MAWRERLADVARFMVRPTPGCGGTGGWSRAVWPALALLIALDLTFGLLWDEALVLLQGSGAGAALPDLAQTDYSLTEDLFTALLVAPVLEELLFRGWLTGRIAALRFAAYGMIALGLFMAISLVPEEYHRVIANTAVAMVIVGLIQWSRTRDRDTAVPGWFTRQFHWLVWGSTLLFGLIHLGNYEALAHPLGVLVVVPQTVGGLLLAYTRTRLGLGAAMAHHAAFNAVYLAVAQTG